MFRKLIWGMIALTVVGLLTFGSDLWSYVRTGAHWVTSSIRSQVPLEFELERAQKLIAELTPEIESNLHAIAEEEVAIEQLDRRVRETETRLAVGRRQMATLRDAAASGQRVTFYHGTAYTAEQIKTDLGRRVDAYKQADANMSTQRRILAARSKSLEAARKKLTNMHQAKRDLQAQVAELDAQKKMLDAVQAASRIQMDDSKLAQAKESLRKLQHRLQVVRKLVEQQGLLTEGIPVDAAPKKDVLAEVDALLEVTSTDGATLHASAATRPAVEAN
jgi:chromosome segregation ATPase